MIDIQHLRAFVAVAESKNFRIAAERLGISQPTLSARIRKFEETSGEEFFFRTSRKVSLTPAGEEFLPVAIRVINDFELCLAGIADFSQRKRGRVRVAALYSVATGLLPKVVKAFGQTNSNIHIELRDDNSAEVTRRVVKGEVDLGYGDRQSDQPDLAYKPLFRDRMVVAFRAGSPLGQYDEIELEQLAGEIFIGFGSQTGPGRFMQKYKDAPENLQFPGITVWNTPTLEALLLAGAGVSVLPSLAVAHWKPLELEARPLRDPEARRDVYEISRRWREISPAAEAFRLAVNEHVQGFADETGLIEYLGRTK